MDEKKEKELRQKLEVMLPRNKDGNDMLKTIISMAKQKGKEEIVNRRKREFEDEFLTIFNDATIKLVDVNQYGTEKFEIPDGRIVSTRWLARRLRKELDK